MRLAIADLNGYRMEASTTTIGTIGDCLFDDRTWKIRWLVVDTGSWLTGRRLLIHPSAVEVIDHDLCVVKVALTPRQVEAGPSLRVGAPICRDAEDRFFDHYGWDPYWGDSWFGTNAMAAPLGASRALGFGHSGSPHGAVNSQPDGDPHLRSVAGVTGFHLCATDGTIGVVDGFLIEEPFWVVRYLVADARNWWPGRHVLVSPFAVTGIRWADRELSLDLAQDRVKASPQWDPEGPLDLAYQQLLHGHYSWPVYET